MSKSSRQAAPHGDLATYAREHFTHDGATRDIYRKGSGPAVLVIAEMPGITPHVLGFADRVVALGCTAILPQLFGTPGRDPMANGKLRAGLYGLNSVLTACASRDFVMFALNRSSPVVDWLKRLAAFEHERCGGPGVGVVGMCFTGGFALAMATDPRVVAPVLAEPSLPVPLTANRKHAIDCSDADIDVVARRCQSEGLRVLGVRFRGDRMVPGERFRFLKERLGDGFIAVELAQADGHPDGPMGDTHHSVLTGDLIDEPGEPTLAALQQVLALFRSKLIDKNTRAWALA
jgi:dienelactone hydrolase